jgi:hypothetical protein
VKGDDAFDPTAKLKLDDPGEFLAQEARREKALRMQELVRPGRTTPIAVRFDQFTLKHNQSPEAGHGGPAPTRLGRPPRRADDLKSQPIKVLSTAS